MPLNHSFESNRSTRGFTLIELLIVVAIIAILAAIAVPNFLEAQTRSKVSRVKADHRSLTTALEAYRVDYNNYPPSWKTQDGTQTFLPGPQPGVVGLVGTTVSVRIQRLAWITTPIAYMTSIPLDPFSPEKDAAPGLNSQNPVSVYWDSPFTDFRKVSNANLFLDSQGEQNRRLSFLLTSFGPDRIFEAAVGGLTSTEGLKLYDATNGTLSKGDIFRSAGGILNN